MIPSLFSLKRQTADVEEYVRVMLRARPGHMAATGQYFDTRMFQNNTRLAAKV